MVHPGKFISQRPQAARFFNRIDILAHEIFDELMGADADPCLNNKSLDLAGFNYLYSFLNRSTL
jgi:hypothetical protein